jgi:hypothetical protein
LIFNENFILGSCHPAVVSFICKKWETSKKICFDRVRSPWRGLKKAHQPIRGVTPLMMGNKKAEFCVDLKI